MILENVVQLAPFIYKLIGETRMGISDLEKFVWAKAGSGLELGPFEVGNTIPLNSFADLCIKEGKEMVGRRQENGKWFVAYGQPIFENGKIVGSIVYAKTDYDTPVKEAMSDLRTISSSVVGQSSFDIERVRRLRDAIMEIEQISVSSKFLSLNASIEANRANNATFGVISQEMQKLSEQIKTITETTQGEMEQFLDTIGDFTSYLHYVNDTVEKINSNLKTINEL